ncbi:hypothetical protein CABS01_16773 [Colletotrichum abscissum]|uniref:uncharacterized protein n=1 Tax=Colletotrichum abscissum TaxID=1671311 RepID=UPI0027D67560|nr:uncharacterized protein CABS01_16773 [Colletotrichum abscissum]KAK1513940.1 hypothetical protein CABS01_16773 [Colletotrichum abscissum]
MSANTTTFFMRNSPCNEFSIAEEFFISRTYDQRSKSKKRSTIAGPCAERSLSAGQNSTSGTEANHFESAVNPSLLAQKTRYILKLQTSVANLAPALCVLPYDSFEHDSTTLAAASERDAALDPEFKFEFPMTHWVVYLLLDSGKLIYNGLSAPYCVPLDRVHGFGAPMLQSMKENQCLRSEWGCHEKYPNALTIELEKKKILIFYVAYLDFRPPNPFI